MLLIGRIDDDDDDDDLILIEFDRVDCFELMIELILLLGFFIGYLIF